MEICWYKRPRGPLQESALVRDTEFGTYRKPFKYERTEVNTCRKRFKSLAQHAWGIA
ncbi:MAG: hypothetical protein QXM75_00565 [Candidatus Diapherotrites archaeon]